MGYARLRPPGDDAAGEVIKHGREIDPAPTDDLEVGEVGLSHLVPSQFTVEVLVRKGWRDEFAFGFDLFNNVGPYCSAYRSISRLIATLATHLLQSREPLVESLAQSFGLDADFVE